MSDPSHRSHGASPWSKVSGAFDDGPDPDAPCPCGGTVRGASYGRCCGPVVEGTRRAETAEELMRSRYTAYADADADHLFRSWHPRTRPDSVDASPWVDWVGLDVLDVVDGGADDEHGVVEFRAHWRTGEGVTRQEGEVHERSRFSRRAGRWCYVGPADQVTGS